MVVEVGGRSGGTTTALTQCAESLKQCAQDCAHVVRSLWRALGCNEIQFAYESADVGAVDGADAEDADAVLVCKR